MQSLQGTAWYTNLCIKVNDIEVCIYVKRVIVLHRFQSLVRCSVQFAAHTKYHFYALFKSLTDIKKEYSFPVKHHVGWWLVRKSCTWFSILKWEGRGQKDQFTPTQEIKYTKLESDIFATVCPCRESNDSIPRKSRDWGTFELTISGNFMARVGLSEEPGFLTQQQRFKRQF